MQLDRHVVEKVAELARLKLSDDELTMYIDQLSRVLDYVTQLNEVDVSNVEPMVHAFELENVLRPDEVVPSLPRTDALQNAPKTDGHYFLVPAVLQG
jgi:aspartyl-tRNA(Asn)/glutamyl-tRNA(Gln) amidotransferase subunit C